jgi:prepilin-type N-terminal cleavage/methylation domain-containing protein
MMRNRCSLSKTGFTLFELMIVLAVLTLLATIMTPQAAL